MYNEAFYSEKLPAFKKVHVIKYVGYYETLSILTRDQLSSTP